MESRAFMGARVQEPLVADTDVLLADGRKQVGWRRLVAGGMGRVAAGGRVVGGRFARKRGSETVKAAVL